MLLPPLNTRTECSTWEPVANQPGADSWAAMPKTQKRSFKLSKFHLISGPVYALLVWVSRARGAGGRCWRITPTRGVWGGANQLGRLLSEEPWIQCLAESHPRKGTKRTSGVQSEFYVRVGYSAEVFVLQRWTWWGHIYTLATKVGAAHSGLQLCVGPESHHHLKAHTNEDKHVV